MIVIATGRTTVFTAAEVASVLEWVDIAHARQWRKPGPPCPEAAVYDMAYAIGLVAHIDGWLGLTAAGKATLTALRGER